MPTGVYKRKPLSEETKLKISIANTGKKRSDEAKLKMRLAKLGKDPWNKNKKGVYSDESIEKMRLASLGKRLGKDNHKWKGDLVGKNAVHSWVKRRLGAKNKCDICGTEDKNKKYQWSNKDHKYKRRLKDWQRLCWDCHREYDIKNNNYLPFNRKIT